MGSHTFDTAHPPPFFFKSLTSTFFISPSFYYQNAATSSYKTVYEAFETAAKDLVHAVYPLPTDGSAGSKATIGIASRSSAPTPGRSSVGGATPGTPSIGGTPVLLTPARNLSISASHSGFEAVNDTPPTVAGDTGNVDRVVSTSPTMIGAVAAASRFNSEGVTSRVASAVGLKTLRRITIRRERDAEERAERTAVQQRVKGYEVTLQKRTATCIQAERRRQKVLKRRHYSNLNSMDGDGYDDDDDNDDGNDDDDDDVAHREADAEDFSSHDSDDTSGSSSPDTLPLLPLPPVSKSKPHAFAVRSAPGGTFPDIHIGIFKFPCRCIPHYPVLFCEMYFRPRS